MSTFKKVIAMAMLAMMVAACTTEASTVSKNLSKAADSFEVSRRIIFFNGITDTYLMVIEGRCSITKDAEDAQLEVTCAVGDERYKKHFLGISDNVSYFVEQIEAAKVDPFRYRVIFRPESVLPDLDVQS